MSKKNSSKGSAAARTSFNKSTPKSVFANTVSIPRQLAEQIAEQCIETIECHTRAWPKGDPVAGYKKALRDCVGGQYEDFITSEAEDYRILMLALGKGQDLPEPRQFVRNLKRRAAAAITGLSEFIDAPAQRHFADTEMLHLARSLAKAISGE